MGQVVPHRSHPYFVLTTPRAGHAPSIFLLPFHPPHNVLADHNVWGRALYDGRRRDVGGCTYLVWYMCVRPANTPCADSAAISPLLLTLYVTGQSSPASFCNIPEGPDYLPFLANCVVLRFTLRTCGPSTVPPARTKAALKRVAPKEHLDIRCCAAPCGRRSLSNHRPRHSSHAPRESIKDASPEIVAPTFLPLIG